MQKQIKRALGRAGIDTSRHMSVGLRKEARTSGWPRHIVNSMRLNYTRNGFSVHIHDRHVPEAMDYEYGTTERQPTAAIRRYMNRSQSSETHFLNRLVKHLGIE